MRTLKSLVGLALVPAILPWIGATCFFPNDPVYRQWRAGFFAALRGDVRTVCGW